MSDRRHDTFLPCICPPQIHPPLPVLSSFTFCSIYLPFIFPLFAMFLFQEYTDFSTAQVETLNSCKHHHRARSQVQRLCHWNVVVISPSSGSPSSGFLCNLSGVATVYLHAASDLMWSASVWLWIYLWPYMCVFSPQFSRQDWHCQAEWLHPNRPGGWMPAPFYGIVSGMVLEKLSLTSLNWPLIRVVALGSVFVQSYVAG